MTAHIRVGGSWKEFDPRIKVGGTWKNVDEGYVKVNGEWEKFYIKQIYVANLGNTNIAYSTDFISWTVRTGVLSPTPFTTSIASRSEDKFVFGGGFNRRQIWSSTDAINWQVATLPNNANQNEWYRGIYGQGKFIAISGGGYTSNVFATSTDAINWTARSMPVVTNWGQIAYNGSDTFVVGQQSNGNIICRSTDGITWTRYTSPTTATNYRCMTYSPYSGLFISAPFNGTITVVSTNGITWTQYASFPSGVYPWILTYGNNYVATVGSNERRVLRTTNGISWASSTTPTGVFALNFFNDKFYTIGEAANYFSTNLVTWTAYTTSGANVYGILSSRKIQ